MKTRRVVVTIEMDTDWPLGAMKDQLKAGGFPLGSVVKQIQANLIRPAAKKPKK